MRILVTGGAGFIGSHLIDRLLEDGLKVICVDNFDPYYDPILKMENIKHHLKKSRKQFKLFRCDIRNVREMEKIFYNNKVDKVIHLAAKVGVRYSVETPMSYEDVNIKGTLILLELIKKYNVEQFIFASSSSVYGIESKVPFKEDEIIDKPLSPYGASKRSCELLCYTYYHLYHIPIVCLRFFTVYGPRQRPDMAIYRFTTLIGQSRVIQLYGDPIRDYTYVEDAVNGILLALKRQLKKYEVINIGNSNPVKLSKIIKLIEEKLHKKAKIKHLPRLPADMPVTWTDISKAKKLLGYTPKIRVDEGIEKFINWYYLN